MGKFPVDNSGALGEIDFTTGFIIFASGRSSVRPVRSNFVYQICKQCRWEEGNECTAPIASAQRTFGLAGKHSIYGSAYDLFKWKWELQSVCQRALLTQLKIIKITEMAEVCCAIKIWSHSSHCWRVSISPLYRTCREGQRDLCVSLLF